MRVILFVVLAVVAWTGSAAAQPLDGDIVLSFLDGTAMSQGAVIYFNPAKPTVLTTLSRNVTPRNFQNWVRMAPNNTDVVVAEVDSSSTTCRMINIDPSGIGTTIVNNLFGGMQGFELDGDDTWIVAASATSLFAVKHSTGAWSTITLLARYPTFNEVCILREQGYKYVVANFTRSTLLHAKLYAADRSGITSTLMMTAGNPLQALAGIEVDPKTGDFITVDFEGPLTTPPEPNGTEVNRVTVGGKVTTLTTFGVNGCRINPDDTVWIGGFSRGIPSNTVGVMKFDLSTNTVVTVITMPGIPTTLGISAIEVYGSHPLTCNGQGGPGQTIAINLNSKRSLAAGAGYQIALSFARRPGIKMKNGEWLHLNVTDGLFLLTAQNLAPAIFQNFAGFLTPFGTGKAQIKLPKGFPASLNITVFCAGVIFTPLGVVQVTNTHWFEI